MKICVKCGRERNERYMQEAVFRNFVGDEGAGIWKCASNESCKKSRKVCDKCKHYLRHHETPIKLTNETVYECIVNVGMGDWCGCKEKR